MPKVVKKPAEVGAMAKWMKKGGVKKEDLKEEAVEPAAEAPVKTEVQEEEAPSKRPERKVRQTTQKIEVDDEGEEEENEEPVKKGRKKKDSESKALKTKRTATKKPKKEEKDEDEGAKEVPKKRKAFPKGETAEQTHLRENEAPKVLGEVGASKKFLGYHVSGAGSLEQGIYNAVSTGCRSFAFFVRNQRTWNHRPMEDSVVERWNETLKETNFDINMILPHGSYLMNPGSPDKEKLEKTRDAMLDECRRCERLGIKYYNFHPGSTTGVGTRKQCIDTVAESINYIIDNTSFIILVIETMAGQGNTVGGTFKEIKEMIDGVKDKERVGVCIDTCHIFAAGYDIRTPKAYEKTMKEFVDVIGYKYLKAFHLNDSKGDLGCNLDRHEHIGKGKIGETAFSLIMNDPHLNDIPLVLETPEGDYMNEMILMYKMDKENAKTA